MKLLVHPQLRWVATVACLLALAASALAADVTASLSGVARDPSGAVVPGAKITATHLETNASFQATTDQSGAYSLRSLPVGQYTLVAELSGFKKYTQTGILLRVNEQVRADISLDVGAVTETVTVSGLSTVVETNTVTLKTVVDERRISELPLNGRNPAQLMLLVAGVQTANTGALTSGATYPGAMVASSNGGRGNTTNFVLDGGSHNDHYNNLNNPFPNPDALQEFSVQTNNFSAEYGRNSGAIVNAVTKSGTNSLHGSAFEFVRNSALNASNFFTPGREDGLKRNQFGATVGGPVVLPRLINGRDRMFFFFSYQGTRLRQLPAGQAAVVPTPAQRRGDFSSFLPRTQLRDPVTRQPYPNNQIPVAQFDPAARRILDEFLPVPADPSGLIRFSAPIQASDDQTLGRMDYNWVNHKLTGRFYVSNFTTPAFLDRRNVLSSSRATNTRNTSLVLNDTHIIRPTLLHNFVFTFNRSNSIFQPDTPPSYPSLGIRVYNDGNPQWFFSVSGFFGINTGDTNEFTRNDFQWADTVRWTRGRHEISFGGEVVRGRGDITNNFRGNGRYTFSGVDLTGSPLADFFLGRFQNYNQGGGEYKKTRSTALGFFFQDTIRVTPRLTLNVGLRYDPFFPYTDVDGRLAGFRPGKKSTRFPNAPLGVVFPGDSDLPDGGYDNDWNNWGPRLGLAWDPFGDGKTSVRAAYGAFYDRPNTISTNSPANQSPFSTQVTIFGDGRLSIVDPFAGTVNPFPAPRTPGKEAQFFLPHQVFSFDPDYRSPQLQTWHFTLERQLFSGWLARAAYAGSKGTHLLFGQQLNPAIFAPGATTGTTNQRRPLAPTFASITNIQSTSNSTYHSLQLTLDKRFTRGFSVLTSYTWSKSLDDTSENKGTGLTVVNPFNLRFHKGPADFDHAHRMVTSYLWELPVKFPNRLVHFLFGDWTHTGIVTLQSGQPLTVGSGVDNARSGIGGQRADLIGNPFLPGGRPRGERILRWFNNARLPDPNAAFAPNALGTFGASGRGILRGPGFAQVDLGLYKDFPFSESARLQFRFEMFNAFNRVNLGNPSTGLNDARFGQILSAGEPRILQLALRLTF